jgi:hypothetical protein
MKKNITITLGLLIFIVSVLLLLFYFEKVEKSILKDKEVNRPIKNTKIKDKEEIVHRLGDFKEIYFLSIDEYSVDIEFDLSEMIFENSVKDSSLPVYKVIFESYSSQVLAGDDRIKLLDGKNIKERIEKSLKPIFTIHGNVIFTDYPTSYDDDQLGYLEVDEAAEEYRSLPTGSISQTHITGMPPYHLEVEDEYRFSFKQVIDGHLIFTGSLTDSIGYVWLKDDYIIRYGYDGYELLDKLVEAPIKDFDQLDKALKESKFTLFYDSVFFGNDYHEGENRDRESIILNEVSLHYLAFQNKQLIPFFLVCGDEYFSDKSMGDNGVGRVCGGMEAIDHEKLEKEKNAQEE